MTRSARSAPQQGFTLVELLVALGIFLLITGAAFTLLGSSQQRFRSDTQVLSSFQEARLGLDQIVRDINDSGYPPPTFNGGFPNMFASTPFAWSPGYQTLNPCTVDISCATPSSWDIIVETNPNPQDVACAPKCVQWIRYQLQNTTLFRGVVYKTAGDDPAFDTSAAGILVPFVLNVVNNVCPAQLSTCQSAYPGLFPGGNPVPIFTYYCDTPTTPQSPAPLCSNAVTDNSPANIRDVTVTLIVAAPLPDAASGLPRLVTLNGRGRRVNPNQ
jgi:prepilin-type N-terminal cleavage/methylation domain-containing protein